MPPYFKEAPMLVQIDQAHPQATGMPLLRAGFRPFFLLAGVQATLLVPLWLAQVLSGLSLSLPYTPSLWHGHEMIFGFGGAAVAGFLLTAIPNWTGIATPTGGKLGALVALWLAARIGFALGGALPPWVAAVPEMLFLPAVGIGIAVPLIRAGKPRNTVFLALLAVLTVADGLVVAEMNGLASTGRNGLYLGLFLLVTMIGIIGGRIIPGFTQNGLRQAGIAWQPPQRPLLDKLCIVSLVAVAAAEAASPGAVWGGALCLVAAGLHAVRLAGWNGWRTTRIPLLWVLHLGYSWVPVGLFLVGTAALAPSWLGAGEALHALTVGAVGTMVLGVMSRAALGHSGRPLVLAPMTVAAYLLVWSAGWLRVLGPLVDPTIGLWLSGLAWSLGFALYVTVYAPICLSARADGKQG
jgi:uncharacterized protein involved in response to NO